MIPCVSWGQTDTLDVPIFLEYLSEGDAEGIVSYADDYLELALLQQPQRYSRSQAFYVLKTFFRQYPPDEFELHHNLTHGEEWWLIGHFAVQDQLQSLRFYLRFGGVFPAVKLLAIQVIPA
ncbi:MAG: DUF4783 domain-containing protein [Bacteroidetes bacterium]|nr:DUF4783 domain-containing protein [Bacteroidota bacterium]